MLMLSAFGTLFLFLLFYYIIKQFQPPPFGCFVGGDSAGPNPLGSSSRCARLWPQTKQAAFAPADGEQWTDRGFLLA